MNTNELPNPLADSTRTVAEPVVAAPATAANQQPIAHEGISENTKTIVTVLLLLFAFPIGLIVMFIWPKWAWWVKLLVTIPVLLIGFFTVIFIGAMLVAVNPSAQIEKAECVRACEEAGDVNCVEMCSVTPSASGEITPEDPEGDGDDLLVAPE